MNLLLPILSKLAVALLSEFFVKRLIYRTMLELSKATENQYDDDVVKFMGEAWDLTEKDAK